MIPKYGYSPMVQNIPFWTMISPFKAGDAISFYTPVTFPQEAHPKPSQSTSIININISHNISAGKGPAHSYLWRNLKHTEMDTQ